MNNNLSALAQNMNSSLAGTSSKKKKVELIDKKEKIGREILKESGFSEKIINSIFYSKSTRVSNKETMTIRIRISTINKLLELNHKIKLEGGKKFSMPTVCDILISKGLESLNIEE